MMSDTLVKFRKLTQVFDPIYRPYEDADDGPGGSYVPEAHEDYRNNLVRTLELNDRVKLLVAGQPGCGKTTLLLSVAHHLRRQGRLVVFVDLERQAAVHDLSSIELHLAVILELLAEATKQGAHLQAATIERTRVWVERVHGRGSLQAEPAALASALQRMLSSVRARVALREVLRAHVKEVGELPLSLLSMMLTDLAKRQPVVVVDGLDKLPPNEARDRFFLDDAAPLEDTPGASVVTIPISLVYEPSFNLLSEHYHNADNAILPAVRLYDFDAASRKRRVSERGFDVLRRIVRARVDPIDPDIVSPKAVDSAIIGSGGNIRELARLLQASVVKAHVREHPFVDVQDVAAAIADRRESFRRGYNSEFRAVLQKVHEEYRLDGPDDVTRLLLYGLWIMEYRNGEAWYSLPDPVEQLLLSLERRGA
jgi:energy-coupling factor transporter ATP-binding protein EcfA2